MSNIENTPLDSGSVQVRKCEFGDELITFGGADDLAEGTILARDSSTLKLRLFVKGGSTNGNGIPKVVLAHRVVATGSGDLPCRVIKAGVVDKNRLIIDADGDASNVDAAVLDQLRDYGIQTESVSELGRVDNPQPEVEGS